MAAIYEQLNPKKALIFRIVHRNNLPWILKNGLHCRKSKTQDPNYKAIGNKDLIDKRQYRKVPIHPGGTLGDYVPFYFTPFSPMMLNIHTGRGVPQIPNNEITILVSSLPKLIKLEHEFVFSDRHAYLEAANFYNELSGLSNIEWDLLQHRNFKRDPDNPEPFEKYQAEALIHRKIPTEALLGVVCYTDEVKVALEEDIDDCGVELEVKKLQGWYF